MVLRNQFFCDKKNCQNHFGFPIVGKFLSEAFSGCTASLMPYSIVWIYVSHKKLVSLKHSYLKCALGKTEKKLVIALKLFCRSEKVLVVLVVASATEYFLTNLLVYLILSWFILIRKNWCFNYPEIFAVFGWSVKYFFVFLLKFSRMNFINEKIRFFQHQIKHLLYKPSVSEQDLEG